LIPTDSVIDYRERRFISNLDERVKGTNEQGIEIKCEEWKWSLTWMMFVTDRM
jgi:hypothetical protein